LKNPVFAEGVIARIREAWPNAEITRLERPGVLGAVAMARREDVEVSTLTSVDEAQPLTGRHEAAQSWRPVAVSPTEGRHPMSLNFYDLTLAAAIRLMLEEDEMIPEKILAESEHIEWTVRQVVRAFANGGRLIYCGAGTSGRLGVLDASECPPTFRTPANLVQGIIAKVNQATARVENIRKFRMLTKALDHEDGELTATQKVKRSALMQVFGPLVEDMYSGADRLPGGDQSDIIVVEHAEA
jgi:hypothetical protein